MRVGFLIFLCPVRGKFKVSTTSFLRISFKLRFRILSSGWDGGALATFVVARMLLSSHSGMLMFC